MQVRISTEGETVFDIAVVGQEDACPEGRSIDYDHVPSPTHISDIEPISDLFSPQELDL